MSSTLRMLPRATRAALRTSTSTSTIARRQYATEDYNARTKATLQTSSRLTWALSGAAILAAAAYYTYPSAFSTSSSSPSTSTAPPSSQPTHKPIGEEKYKGKRSAEYEGDVPKPVEDRHGDTVMKHSIAAHKNQNKVREGKFSGKEFDNHEQVHSQDPEKDFEKK